MRATTLIGWLFVIACTAPTPASTPASTPEDGTRRATPTPTPVPVDPPPEPAGASLTLQRTACYGACPIYEITLFESGVAVYRGDNFVTVLGEARKAVAPATVAKLLEEAEALFSMQGLPAEPTVCGTDMPRADLTIRRDGDTRTRSVSSSCTLLLGNETPASVDVRLRKRGMSYDVLVAAETFADAIDLAVPSAPWVDDPVCRDLRGTLLGKHRTSELEDWMVDRIRRTADDALRIRVPFPDTDEAKRHRDRLVARGVPEGRIVIERMRHMTRDYGFAGIELTIGPSHCFAAVRAGASAP